MASKENEEEKAMATYQCNRWTGRVESGEAGGRDIAVTAGQLNSADVTPVVVGLSLTNWEQPTRSRSICGGLQLHLLAQQVLKTAAGDSEWCRIFIAWLLDRPFLAGSGPNLQFTNLRQARVLLNEVRKFFNSSPEALLLPLKPLLPGGSADEDLVQSLRGMLFHLLPEGRSRYSGRNQLQQAADLDIVCWNEVQDLGRLDRPPVIPPRQFSSQIVHKILCGLLHTLALGHKTGMQMPSRISALSPDLTVSVLGRRLRPVRSRSARLVMKGDAEHTRRWRRRLETEIPTVLCKSQAPGTVPDGDNPAGRSVGDYLQEAEPKAANARGCMREARCGTRKQQNCLKVGDACTESHVSDHSKSATNRGGVEMKPNTSNVLHELGSPCMSYYGVVQDSPAADVPKKRPYRAMVRGTLMGSREKLRRAAHGTWMTTKRLRGGDDVRSAWSAKHVADLSEFAVKCEPSEKVRCEVEETVLLEVCSKPGQSVASHFLDYETPVLSDGGLDSAVVPDAADVEGSVGDDEHDDMHTVNVYATVLSNLSTKVAVPISLVESNDSCPQNRRKRKNQAAEGMWDSESDSSLDELGKQGRVEKRVRFSLRYNIVWTPPNCPLPPLFMRTPPSATPRGSALKKGVLPGPICHEPVICKTKLSSRSSRRSRSHKKNLKTIGRSAKKTKAHRSTA